MGLIQFDNNKWSTLLDYNKIGIFKGNYLIIECSQNSTILFRLNNVKIVLRFNLLKKYLSFYLLK